MSLFFFDGEKTLFEEMDDLTTFELEQIARLEAKCVEARHKSSQEWSILEQNFHKIFFNHSRLAFVIFALYVTCCNLQAILYDSCPFCLFETFCRLVFFTSAE